MIRLLLILGLFVGQLDAATRLIRQNLREAVAAAAAGDTLVLDSATPLTGPLVIDKALRLSGTKGSVIDGGGIGSTLVVRAPGVVLENVRIRNSGADLTKYDSGVLIEAPFCQVLSCVIETDGFGIFVRGVNGCNVDANEISGRHDSPASKRGNGIHLWNTKSNSVTGNVIREKRDGIYFSYCHHTDLEKNTISDTRFGIHYMYSHDNQIRGNRLSGNAVGAALMFSRNLKVADNLAFANRRHGFLLKQVETSRIDGNLAVGQNRGFFVQQCAQNRFESNVIATNDIGLYLSSGSEQNTFVGNAFVGNVDQVWQPPEEYDRGRTSLNMFDEKGRGNFWSDYVAPAGRGGSRPPYHETDLYGYILERHPAARVFAMSPAVALIRKGEELLPVLDAPGITDLYPMPAKPASAAALLATIAALPGRGQPLAYSENHLAKVSSP